jgi:hypothetical protein
MNETMEKLRTLLPSQRNVPKEKSKITSMCTLEKNNFEELQILNETCDLIEKLEAICCQNMQKIKQEIDLKQQIFNDERFPPPKRVAYSTVFL